MVDIASKNFIVDEYGMTQGRFEFLWWNFHPSNDESDGEDQVNAEIILDEE